MRRLPDWWVHLRGQAQPGVTDGNRTRVSRSTIACLNPSVTVTTSRSGRNRTSDLSVPNRAHYHYATLRCSLSGSHRRLLVFSEALSLGQLRERSNRRSTARWTVARAPRINRDANAPPSSLGRNRTCDGPLNRRLPYHLATSECGRRRAHGERAGRSLLRRGRTTRRASVEFSMSNRGPAPLGCGGKNRTFIVNFRGSLAALAHRKHTWDRGESNPPRTG